MARFSLGRWLMVAAIGVGLGLAGVFSGRGASAQESAKKTTAARGISVNVDEEQIKRLEEKLDQVLANQTKILEQFDVVKEELRIIKIRATLRGGS